MSARELPLPKFTGLEAARSRTRNTPRATITFESELFPNAPLRLSLDTEGFREFGPDESRLTFVWGGARLELRCPVNLPKQMLAAFDPALQLETMPSDLSAFLLEAAMLKIVALCEQATGRDISITAMDRADFQAPDEGLRLALDYGGQRWGLLLTAAAGREKTSDPLSALLHFWPIAPRSMDHFRLSALLRLGTTTMSFAAFKSLRTGDAVLLQTGGGKNYLLVIAESWTAIAQRRNAEWQLLEAPKPAFEVGRMEWTLRSTDAVEGEQGGYPINDPDQISVQLTFEVGKLEITLAELRRLGAGSILELGRGVAEPIRISAQGRPVGHGELVEVEGVVGVRVTRLFDYE
jgi:type III secretion protein Q